MTITSSALEGFQHAESLLDYASSRIAGNGGNGSAEDEVSLSDAAVAQIQAKVLVAASVSALHAANAVQKALIDLVG